MNTTQKSKDMFLKKERVDLDNDEEYEQNRCKFQYLYPVSLGENSANHRIGQIMFGAPSHCPSSIKTNVTEIKTFCIEYISMQN